MYLINCSLNPNSKGRKVFDKILEENPDFKGIDLIEKPLPLCNGYEQSSYQNAYVKEIHDQILASKGILFIAPVYNWNVNSTAKNFIELLGTPYQNQLTGKVFHNKVIGVIMIASSPHSFLAPLNFLNNMMVDFQSFIVPKYTLLSREDFKEDGSFHMTHVHETLKYFKFMTKALSNFEKVI